MLDEGGPHSAFFSEEHGSVAGSENLLASDLARSQGQLCISKCKMVQMFVGCMLRHSWMRMMMEVFDGFILSHRYVLCALFSVRRPFGFVFVRRILRSFSSRTYVQLTGPLSARPVAEVPFKQLRARPAVVEPATEPATIARSDAASERRLRGRRVRVPSLCGIAI